MFIKSFFHCKAERVPRNAIRSRKSSSLFSTRLAQVDDNLAEPQDPKTPWEHSRSFELWRC